MSGSQFTPGPWSALPSETDKLYVRVRGTRLGERYKVANALMAAESKFERDEAEANARLIAAAPELYEALEAFNLKERDIVSGTADSLTLRVSLDTVRKAAAALAKARSDQ